MRYLETHEIASAIARWCRSQGIKVYCVGTNRISETEVVVEASVDDRREVNAPSQ